jgi:hypothetical protein
MAIVKQVQKKVIMSKKGIIKFQLLTHCYIKDIAVSNSDLECLTLLSSVGPIELTHFCYDAAEEHKIFKSQQTVRNCINKCIKNNLIKKDFKNKKIISINKTIKVETNGTIFLDYKFLGK